MPEREMTITPTRHKRELLVRELKLGGLWLFSALFPHPYLLGMTGELRVHNCLVRGLPIGAQIWSDVLLPTPKGTVQVDLIVFVGNRVFVVEVKNRTGRVKGRSEDRTWKWVVGKRRGTLYNPVRQARRHARHLTSVLNCEVVPLVAFAGSARVDTDAPCVFTSPRKLLDSILTQYQNTLSVDDPVAQAQATSRKLAAVRMAGTWQEKSAHVRHARKVASEQEQRAQAWHRRQQS